MALFSIGGQTLHAWDGTAPQKMTPDIVLLSKPGVVGHSGINLAMRGHPFQFQTRTWLNNDANARGLVNACQAFIGAGAVVVEYVGTNYWTAETTGFLVLECETVHIERRAAFQYPALGLNLTGCYEVCQRWSLVAVPAS